MKDELQPVKQIDFCTSIISNNLNSLSSDRNIYAYAFPLPRVSLITDDWKLHLLTKTILTPYEVRVPSVTNTVLVAIYEYGDIHKYTRGLNFALLTCVPHLNYSIRIYEYIQYSLYCSVECVLIQSDSYWKLAYIRN